MRKVAIVGAGMTTFGDHPALGVKELFHGAVADLTAGMGGRWDPQRLDAAYIGSLSSGQGFQLGNLAPSLLEYAGLPPVAALHVESACASGGYALMQAVLAVASGTYDCVLAAGVEKMRDVSGERGRYWLGVSGDTEYERLSGLTFAGIFGIMAGHLMQNGVITRNDLSQVAVKNHRHGALNPRAQLRRPLTVEQVESAPLVAAPLTAMDCCPTTDGAAAVLVVSAELAPMLADAWVEVTGWGAASDRLAVHSRQEVARLYAVERAAAAAYRMSGTDPADLDLVELHDCFTVAELIAYQELGLCRIAEAGDRLRAGEFSLGGRLPVNPSGGLKAKGHPIGATGVAQAVEIFHQLCGTVQDPRRQVRDAEVALSANMGGSGASATVFTYRRR